jgi:hypothetical protein
VAGCSEYGTETACFVRVGLLAFEEGSVRRVFIGSAQKNLTFQAHK